MSIDIFNVLGGSSSGNSLIPARDPGSVTGSAWIQTNMDLMGAVRENNILQEFLHGNIPDFLRKFTSIAVSDGTNTLTYLVMPDVLCIGSNEDYVRMPMNPHTAQAIADKYDCTLPTKKMADQIWKNAVNKLEPKPWGPPYDLDMEKTHRIGTHNSTIQAQLSGLDPTALTSGHKKDVVLTNHLSPNNPAKRVAIYGWFQLNGQPIQGLNPVSHEDTYADYSHGIRLIVNDVIVNGTPMRMKDIFADSQLSKLVSDEGVVTFTRY
jgi:predicted RNA-binding protein